MVHDEGRRQGVTIKRIGKTIFRVKRGGERTSCDTVALK